jgi:alpha-tubulin suppressor-like RCC1 family protein
MRLAIVACVVGCLNKPPRPGDDAVGPGSTDAIGAGGAHACQVADQKLYCWGDDSHGELGDGATGETGTPVRVGARADWAAVAAGAAHTCGIAGGSVYCWGADDTLQGGTTVAMPTIATTQVTLPVGATTPVKVYAGDTASCVIDDTAQLFCWGTINGEMFAPTKISPAGSTTWSSVALAVDHACALASDTSAAWCWGNNGSEQLGVTTTTAATAVNAVTKLHNGAVDAFAAIAVRDQQSCGVRAGTGELVCWGTNAFGLRGDGPPATDDATVDSARAWTTVALGSDFACAIADQSVYCWGADPDGAEGDGLDTFSATIGDHVVASSTSAIALGSRFACATDTSSKASCWGQNIHGELGNGEIARVKIPTAIALAGAPTAVAVGLDHACAVVGGEVSCWGNNLQNQLFPMGTKPSYVPTPAPEGFTPTDTTMLTAGDFHTCARSAATTRCWGDNSAGQAPPTSLPLTNVSAGGQTTCGAPIAGTQVTCYGTEPGTSTMLNGQSVGVMWSNVAVDSELAIGNESNDLTRVFEFGMTSNGVIDPGGAQTIASASAAVTSIQLAVGGSHGCVMFGTTLLTSELDCFGDNTDHQSAPSGQLAVAQVTIPPPAMDSWPASPYPVLAAATSHTCAITIGGVLECWGKNEFALGPLQDVSSGPAEITHPMGIQWSQIATGATDSCAIDLVGNLYCWGLNKYGEVGNGVRFHGEPVAVVMPN